ncbi:hypothetical protein IAQ61_002533, partial [Plenodomus lingam]|uniref:uncharacterized protein n=1 Tax=Leptosphaeria maculans TaxID=5022 RepID=UPI00333077DD
VDPGCSLWIRARLTIWLLLFQSSANYGDRKWTGDVSCSNGYTSIEWFRIINVSGDVVSALDCRDDSQDFWNEYRILRVQHGSKKVELQRHGSVAWGTVGYIQATYKTETLPNSSKKDCHVRHKGGMFSSNNNSEIPQV